MQDWQPQTDTSALAIAAAAAPQLYPEPEWLAHAADELGYGWARLAWQRAAAVSGAWFDAAKAQAVVDRWPTWFKLTVGRFAGIQFRLSPWQEIIVRLLVGWKAPTEVIDPETYKPTQVHVRLFRELRLWVPRKNGKSEFLAALALLFWAIEGQRRGAGFCFAHDENQAREVFNKMGDMVAYAPAVFRSRATGEPIKVFAKQLWNAELRSPFVLMPGKAKGKHGRAPFVTVGDEMHEWVSTELADTLRQGEGTSLQPIRLYASTAGLKSQKTGYRLWEESQKILDGRIDDPSTLVVIFAAAEDADWRDPKAWRAANPSLGLSPTIAFLQGEVAKAVTPAAEAAFRRYHLNQWVEDFARWISVRKWDAASPDREAWKRLGDELKGRECVISFDSTKSFDLASMCLRFPPIEKGERTKFLWHFWLPSETIEKRVAAERTPFDQWARDGAIVPIAGGVFELDYAVNAALKACADYRVTKIGWDSWNALEFYNRMVKAGQPEDLFVEMRFGTKSLGLGTREFERKVFGLEMDHGGNPVARWMVGHCNVRFDENMNYVPAKKRSEDSIDGVVAAVMAEALAMVPEAPTAGLVLL
ncbi:terminase TerL endonuclease subunit [Bradyrhizobium sp. WSM4349]|uniref:terminase TerL endonuclease subunit n=1 Tax=Bradyrhizobium sp. WSM4349 TaxID=1040988 RepID=UPI0003610F4C|nr:terminase TerL endonuclease subunit [Bradyrhizobium sp. WSM4349]